MGVGSLPACHLSGFESRHPSKIIKGRHKQRNGQKNKKIIFDGSDLNCCENEVFPYNPSRSYRWGSYSNDVLQ
jgi:hypothetical protein